MGKHSALTRAILVVLQPPLPNFQHKLPRSGAFAWAIRLLLVWYTVLTTLLVFGLLIVAPGMLPQHEEWRKLPAIPRFARSFAIYTVSNFIWAITSYGSPPEVDRFKIPWLSRQVFSRDWTESESKGQLYTHLQVVPAVVRPFRTGVLTLAPPAGPVPCFWLSRTTPDPQHDKRVFLYLVGGGYVIGTPLLGAFAYSLVHATSSPVFAPDYTKALSVETSFPGPLCEALAAYKSLRSQGWSSEQIVVVGDSAGGGLAWSLLVYLASLKSDLGVPKQVILISVSLICTFQLTSALALPSTGIGQRLQDVPRCPQHPSAARSSSQLPSPFSALSIPSQSFPCGACLRWRGKQNASPSSAPQVACTRQDHSSYAIVFIFGRVPLFNSLLRRAVRCSSTLFTRIVLFRRSRSLSRTDRPSRHQLFHPHWQCRDVSPRNQALPSHSSPSWRQLHTRKRRRRSPLRAPVLACEFRRCAR